MKLPLVGQSYALRSPAAGAQQTLNLYPEFIQDANEGKKGILVGCPGYHLVITLGGGSVRGLWSGDGGYVYAVGGNTLYQIQQNTYLGGNPNSGAASVVNSWVFDVASDSNPVQLFGNGTQLGCVANGYFYVNNGNGPVRAQFQISGYVNTVGTAVTWTGGDDFSTAAIGNTIQIDGVAYTIATVNSPTSITLTGSAGTQNGAIFTAALGSYVTAVTGAYLDGYFIVQRPSGFSYNGTVSTNNLIVTLTAGNDFVGLSPGDGIIINGTGYTVQFVTDATHLVLVQSAGVHAGLTYAAGEDLGRQFNLSAPGDGTTWDPLDFAQKEGNADYINSILVNHEQLIIFGTSSMEIWQNTGNALFPLQRIPGAATREDSFARYACTAFGDKTYYLGGAPFGQPVAYRLNGFTPERISTPAEEQAWAVLESTPSSVLAFGYIEDGHRFWVLNFGSLAWVYDETASAQAGTPMWHQRAGWSAFLGSFTPYDLSYHTFIKWTGAVTGARGGGMHIVGSATSGALYEMNLNYFDDNGATQQWQRTLPAQYAGGKLQFFGRMTLEMETGQTPSGAQPTVKRSYSDDRGNTFGNSIDPLTGGSGTAGKTSQRVFWPSNGASRHRVFRFGGNNKGNTRTVLIDLDLDVDLEP